MQYKQQIPISNALALLQSLIYLTVPILQQRLEQMSESKSILPDQDNYHSDTIDVSTVFVLFQSFVGMNSLACSLSNNIRRGASILNTRVEN